MKKSFASAILIFIGMSSLSLRSNSASIDLYSNPQNLQKSIEVVEKQLLFFTQISIRKFGFSNPWQINDEKISEPYLNHFYNIALNAKAPLVLKFMKRWSHNRQSIEGYGINWFEGAMNFVAFSTGDPQLEKLAVEWAQQRLIKRWSECILRTKESSLILASNPPRGKVENRHCVLNFERDLWSWPVSILDFKNQHFKYTQELYPQMAAYLEATLEGFDWLEEGIWTISQKFLNEKIDFGSRRRNFRFQRESHFFQYWLRRQLGENNKENLTALILNRFERKITSILSELLSPSEIQKQYKIDLERDKVHSPENRGRLEKAQFFRLFLAHGNRPHFKKFLTSYESSIFQLSKSPYMMFAGLDVGLLSILRWADKLGSTKAAQILRDFFLVQPKNPKNKFTQRMQPSGTYNFSILQRQSAANNYTDFSDDDPLPDEVMEGIYFFRNSIVPFLEKTLPSRHGRKSYVFTGEEFQKNKELWAFQAYLFKIGYRLEPDNPLKMGTLLNLLQLTRNSLFWEKIVFVQAFAQDIEQTNHKGAESRISYYLKLSQKAFGRATQLALKEALIHHAFKDIKWALQDYAKKLKEHWEESGNYHTPDEMSELNEFLLPFAMEKEEELISLLNSYFDVFFPFESNNSCMNGPGKVDFYNYYDICLMAYKYFFDLALNLSNNPRIQPWLKSLVTNSALSYQKGKSGVYSLFRYIVRAYIDFSQSSFDIEVTNNLKFQIDGLKDRSHRYSPPPIPEFFFEPPFLDAFTQIIDYQYFSYAHRGFNIFSTSRKMDRLYGRMFPLWSRSFNSRHGRNGYIEEGHIQDLLLNSGIESVASFIHQGKLNCETEPTQAFSFYSLVEEALKLRNDFSFDSEGKFGLFIEECILKSSSKDSDWLQVLLSKLDLETLTHKGDGSPNTYTKGFFKAIGKYKDHININPQKLKNILENNYSPVRNFGRTLGNHLLGSKMIQKIEHEIEQSGIRDTTYVYVNGGPTQLYNFSVQEMNLLSFYHTLFNESGIIFNASGRDAETTNTLGIGYAGFVNFNGDFENLNTRPSRITADIVYPATKENLERELERLANSGRKRFTLVFGGHGNQKGLSVWEGDTWAADAFFKTRDKFKGVSLVRSLFLQCHAGTLLVRKNKIPAPPLHLSKKYFNFYFPDNHCGLAMGDYDELGDYFDRNNDVLENTDLYRMFTEDLEAMNLFKFKEKVLSRGTGFFAATPVLTSDYLLDEIAKQFCKNTEYKHIYQDEYQKICLEQTSMRDMLTEQIERHRKEEKRVHDVMSPLTTKALKVVAPDSYAKIVEEFDRQKKGGITNPSVNYKDVMTVDETLFAYSIPLNPKYTRFFEEPVLNFMSSNSSFFDIFSDGNYSPDQDGYSQVGKILRNLSTHITKLQRERLSHNIEYYKRLQKLIPPLLENNEFLFLKSKLEKLQKCEKSAL